MRKLKLWAIVILTFFVALLFSSSAGAVGIQPTGSGSGWQFDRPAPQGNDLLGAWAVGPDDLYVGGHGGVILHWDGAQWTMMDTPTQKTIFAIHGTGSNDIWAVGGDGYTLNSMEHSLIMHYDGTSWEQVTPPDYYGYTYVFNSVYAVSSNNVWACVDSGTAVAHWNGSQWSFILPNLPLEGNLYAVMAVDSNHVFFAGSHGQIVHYNQGVWQLEQKTEEGSFSTDLLQHLWAADLDTVYAGGNWGQVYRRNAEGSWTDLGFPTGWDEDNTIRYLWGTSPTDIYLMGNHSIRHYDGVNEPVRYDFSTILRRQWFGGAGGVDRLFGIGPGGEVDQFILDGLGGGTLRALAPLTDPVGFGSMSLKGAVGYGDNGFVAFGSSVYRSNPYPLFIYDGDTVQPFPELPAGMNNETNIETGIKTGPNQFVVAWDNFLESGRGVHLWNGTGWEQLGEQYEVPGGIKQFWQSPQGNLYACSAMEVSKWDGSSWSAIFPYTDGVVPAAIWGRSDTEIYMGTGQGRIARWDGVNWTMETTPPESGPIASIGGSGTDTYAVGQDGLALYRQGGTWNQLPGIEKREDDNFGQIVVVPDGVFVSQTTDSGIVGGGLGRVWRLSGAGASRILEGLSQPLEAMAVNDNGIIYGIAPLDFIIKNVPVQMPLPSIRADGQGGVVVVQAGEPVSIAISLDPGDYAGQNADWWVVVSTPFAGPGDWFSYVYPGGWRQGIHRCIQTPLFTLSSTEVLGMALPAGNYVFYFALDPPDGQVTAQCFDSVEVQVQ
ncbi:MAG: hypothetical protein J7M32_06075 [Deltaproteobacteria bacterium]|nr:hypothetical protein [Deltaproteobacteria bacterium]